MYVGQIYKTVVMKNIYPLCHGASFYPLLLSFHLQIAHRKVRNLQIDVDKLVGKVLLHLLHHCLFNQHNYQCTCYCFCHNQQLSCQSCSGKQIDLTSVFVTTVGLLAYYISMLLLTSTCKQAPAQYQQYKRWLLIGASTKSFKKTCHYKD